MPVIKSTKRATKRQLRQRPAPRFPTTRSGSKPNLDRIRHRSHGWCPVVLAQHTLGQPRGDEDAHDTDPHHQHHGFSPGRQHEHQEQRCHRRAREARRGLDWKPRVGGRVFRLRVVWVVAKGRDERRGQRQMER